MSIVKTQHFIDNEVIYMYVETGDESIYEGDLYDAERGESKIINISKDILGDGFQMIRDCAKMVVKNVQDMGRDARPDEFELQFMVKLDSEVGAILAKFQSGAQLQVTLKWTKEK